MDVKEFIKKYKPKHLFSYNIKEKICTEICSSFWLNSVYPCQDGMYCPFKQFFDMFESIEELDDEKINPENCKWFQTHEGVLGCFLHPLSDGTPSHCTNSKKYPCKRLVEDNNKKK